MIKYKFDVLQYLKENGYTTYRLKKEKLLSDVTVQRLRDKKIVSIESIDTLCRLLDMQPGNIIKYVEDEK